MTRIVGGQARGRRLTVPARGTRPTSDRVRESCFSSLESRWREDGRTWSEVRVLDLFAGSGALGLEAVSRGAQSAVLVDKSREAVRTITANIDVVGATGVAVVNADAMRLGAIPARVAGFLPADLVFVDPPYEVPSGDVVDALVRAFESGWIKRDATVVVERDARSVVSPLPPECGEVQRRVIGDTALWYGRGAKEVV